MKNDERKIENAPDIFRARLERLRGRGLLADPAFRDAFIQAAAKVRQEGPDESDSIKAEKNGVQKPL